MRYENGYNYDLQQAPESAMRTIESDTRYEWADDITRLGNTVNAAASNYERTLKANKQTQEALLETEFDRDTKTIIDLYQRTPNASRSELDSRIDALIWDPKYATTLTMATKSAILAKSNYQRPLISSVLASNKVAESEAEKTAKMNQRYINLARAYEGPSRIANWSEEAMVSRGKQLAGQQQFTNTLPYLLNLDIPEDSKKASATVTANFLADATIVDIQNQLAQLPPGKAVDTDWWNQYKIQKRQELYTKMAPEWADFIVDTATERFDPLITDIKQSREDFNKSLQQKHQDISYITEENEMRTTGMSASTYREMLHNIGYYDQADRKKLLDMSLKLFKNADQLRSLQQTGYFGDPQRDYDSMNFYYGSSLATANQKLNGTTAALASMNQQQSDAEKNGEANKSDHEKAMSYNLRVMVEDIVNHPEGIVEAYNENASPEQKAFFKQNFQSALKNAVHNEAATLGREALGSVSYKDGQVVSNNKLDKNRVKDFNGLLGNLRAINRYAKGDLFTEKELGDLIKSEFADQALETPIVEGVWDSIQKAPLFVQAAVGRLTGDPDYEWLAMNPRQAVITARTRQRLQQAAVTDLRTARANSVLGPDAVPAPKDERGFWSWLGAATLNVLSETARPIREVYNAPANLAKGELERDLEKIGQSAVEAGEAFGAASKQSVTNVRDWLKSSEDTKQRIKNEEGFTVFVDKNGTVGYGFNLPAIREMSAETKKKLEAIEPGFTTEEWQSKHTLKVGGGERIDATRSSQIFDVLYNVAEADARAFAGDAWNKLSEPRKQALIDMSYNMGGKNLSSFKKLKKAVKEQDYAKAADEILNSKYSKTHANRARRNSNLMRTGQF